MHTLTIQLPKEEAIEIIKRNLLKYGLTLPVPVMGMESYGLPVTAFLLEIPERRLHDCHLRYYIVGEPRTFFISSESCSCDDLYSINRNSSIDFQRAHLEKNRWAAFRTPYNPVLL